MFRTIVIISLAFAFLGNQLFRVQVGSIGVTLLDLVVCFISSGWLIANYTRWRELFIDNKIGRAWLYFIAAALISLTVNVVYLAADDFLIAFLYLVRWICYSAFFFIVIQQTKEQKILLKQVLVWIAGSVVFLGYVQYFFYSSLKNLFYLGWDEHMFRMFSVFLDPNFAGVFYVLYVIYLLGYLVRGPKPLDLRENTGKKIMLFLAIGAVFLTFSRSALVMFVVSLTVFFILENKPKVILSGFVGIVVFMLVASQFFYLENINLFRTVSSLQRLDSASNALQIIQKHPVFGVGFNAYKYAQVRMGFREEKPPIVSHADAGTDNSYLFILATTGVVGTGFYGWFWFTLIQPLLSKTVLRVSVISFVSIISLVGLGVGSMFINALFYPSLLLWIFTVLGLNDYK